MLGLIHFNERYKHFHFVSLRRSWLSLENDFQSLKSPLKIFVIANGLNIH